jgi:hypothetical protein
VIERDGIQAIMANRRGTTEEEIADADAGQPAEALATEPPPEDP